MGDTDFTKSPATKGNVKGVERWVLSTLARAEAVSAENEYERTTEMEFRDASELVNRHVVWVALFIMAMEGGLVLWQVSHMKEFFRREKLIP